MVMATVPSQCRSRYAPHRPVQHKPDPEGRPSCSWREVKSSGVFEHPDIVDETQERDIERLEVSEAHRAHKVSVCSRQRACEDVREVHFSWTSSRKATE